MTNFEYEVRLYDYRKMIAEGAVCADVESFTGTQEEMQEKFWETHDVLVARGSFDRVKTAAEIHTVHSRFYTGDKPLYFLEWRPRYGCGCCGKPMNEGDVCSDCNCDEHGNYVNSPEDKWADEQFWGSQDLDSDPNDTERSTL